MNNKGKGIRFEREIVNQAKALGLIAYRSAASLSLVDCTIIDTQNAKVTFVQCKRGKLPTKERNAIEAFCKANSGCYYVDFILEHKL